MKQFNLEEWLKDRSRKVVTRRGNPARIICTDRKHGEDELPIVFLEECSNGGEFLLTCRSNGRSGKYDTPYDLFFEEEKPEMTPFEKELMIDMDYYVHNLYSLGKTEEERIKWIKAWKPRLLEFASKELDTSVESDSSDFYTELAKSFDDAQHHTASDGYVFAKKYKEKFLELARKELEKDNVIIDKDKYLEICDQYYNNGKKNALKDFPKWKKATEHKDFELNNACILDDDIYPIIATNVNIGEYYIELDELKNLPIEE